MPPFPGDSRHMSQPDDIDRPRRSAPYAQRQLSAIGSRRRRAAGGHIGGPPRKALPYLLPGLCDGLAGVPVVAEASSGTHFITLRSYLKPLAFLSASLVEFMTRYHLLLFLF